MKLIAFAFFMLFSTFILNAQEPNPEKALSLARVESEGEINIIQVTKVTEMGISGFNLSHIYNSRSTSIFDFIAAVGYDTIVSKLKTKTQPTFYKAEHVLPPVKAIHNTIACATNYPEHKEETHVEIEPILYPKIAELTPYISSVGVNVDIELLDYEVELAVVYSKEVHQLEDIHQQLFGFMVCMDYSERGHQLKAYDTDHPELAVGFTDAKSRKDYFPVGPFMVIPKDWKNYYKSLKIQLWRNNEQKQSDLLKSMIWDIEKMTEEALKSGRKESWTFNNTPIPLLPKGYIEKGTIAITGTPGGVVMEPPGKGYIIKKAIEYGLLFKFFKWKPKAYVVDRYVKKLLRKKEYLKPGENVKAKIEKLGFLKSTIKSK